MTLGIELCEHKGVIFHPLGKQRAFATDSYRRCQFEVFSEQVINLTFRYFHCTCKSSVVCVQHEAQFPASVTDKSKHQGVGMPDVGTSRLPFRRYTFLIEQALNYILFSDCSLHMLRYPFETLH